MPTAAPLCPRAFDETRFLIETPPSAALRRAVIASRETVFLSIGQLLYPLGRWALERIDADAAQFVMTGLLPILFAVARAGLARSPEPSVPAARRRDYQVVVAGAIFVLMIFESTSLAVLDAIAAGCSPLLWLVSLGLGAAYVLIVWRADAVGFPSAYPSGRASGHAVGDLVSSRHV